MNVNWVSPSEQVALRVKDELLREGNKTWILPDDAERDRKTEETEEYLGTMDCHTESVQNERLAMTKCINFNIHIW